MLRFNLLTRMNIHKYAVRGEKNIEKEREIERERNRERK